MWKEHESVERELLKKAHEEDREDHKLFLEQNGLTEEQAREYSQAEWDLIPHPEGAASKITIRKSCIEGDGVFLSHPVSAGDLVGVAKVDNLRTPIARYINHSKTPNAQFEYTGAGDVLLVALKDIRGCVGGGQGSEVTVDYRRAIVSAKADKLEALQ